MGRHFMEGSKVVAEAIYLCKPDVVSAYPITPQTHIVETLAQLIADGRIKSRFLEVESEFTAISTVAGAVAAGSRAFTATCSQGLALMHEVLFAIAGMRLPAVMVVANRALSAPINIWNDHQDSISARDSGWIQLYVETAQEAVDTVIQAYKIAEDRRVLLPVMVCMDGFILTHTIEPVNVPDDVEVNKFLPKYKPTHALLDSTIPMTLGPFAYPKPYFKLRKELSLAIDNSEKIIKEVNEKFEEKFKRKYGNGLIEEYKNDKKIAIVSMGSVCGTIRCVVDSREDTGLVKIRCYRPFPKEDLVNALKNKEIVIVIEKNISLGLGSGSVLSEIRDVLYHLKEKPKVVGAVVGLGGTDVRSKDINALIDKSETMKDGEVEWFI
jgi:pyruvate ferredoxin oxidoreductase alpha subunit